MLDSSLGKFIVKVFQNPKRLGTTPCNLVEFNVIRIKFEKFVICNMQMNLFYH